MALEIKTRNYDPADKAFIMATMLKGIYHGATDMSKTPRDAFFAHQGPQLESALDNAFVHIRVAHAADDPELILGYLVTAARSNALIWCFTKAAFRRQGVLTALMGAQTFTHCTLLTPVGNIIRLKKSLDFLPWCV